MADTIYKTPIELGIDSANNQYKGTINFRYNGNSSSSVTTKLAETSSGILELETGKLLLNDVTRKHYPTDLYQADNVVSYSSDASSLTGTIKIEFPFGFEYLMMYIEIDMYLYNTQSASKLIIGAYNYGASSSWVNTSLTTLGAYKNGVRLAFDGTHTCILLGTTSTVWNYPKIVLSKIFSGYSGRAKVFNDGYKISVITSESGYSSIVTLTSKIYNAVYNDYAECFDNSDLIYNDVKNRIVEINNDGKVVLANKNSNRVVGIVSDSYAMLINGTDEDVLNGTKIPVGLAGTLFVQSLENVEYTSIGKMLVADNNGFGKASDRPKLNTIVGKIIGIDKINNRYKILIK